MSTVDAFGSYLVGGGRYRVFHGKGNLFHRQAQANSIGVCCYVEQHMNAHVKQNVNYAMALLPQNASTRTKEWARTYTANVAQTFGIPDRGLLIGPQRGGYNIQFLRAPAMLVEPGFISERGFAARVRSGEGIDALAKCLVDSVIEHFDSGIVGLSVGHAYRGKPDPGAPVNEGELKDPAFDDEVELNDAIIKAAEEMLLAVPGGHDDRRPAA